MGVYSVLDYVIYLLILVVVLGLIRRFLFRYVDLDEKFIYMIVPYMLLGVFVRLLADVGFFEKSQFWSITPGVYILCVVVGLLGLLSGLLLAKIRDVEYWILPTLIGVVGVAYTGFNLLSYLAFPGRMLVPMFMAACVALFFRYAKINPLNRWDNVALVFAHMLDASSTYIAYDFYGFDEEHLLPRFLIEYFGGSAAVMIPAKLVIVLLVIIALENYNQDDDDVILYKMLKIVIFIFGFGPGLRNSLLPSLSL